MGWRFIHSGADGGFGGGASGQFHQRRRWRQRIQIDGGTNLQILRHKEVVEAGLSTQEPIKITRLEQMKGMEK